jgi:hypothetical protein
LVRAGRTLGVALALLALGGGLAAVELRRQGLVEALAFIPDDRPPDVAPPPLPPDLGPGEPLARSLQICLLDGLRFDVAEHLPAWKKLAPRGARLRALVRFPAFSVPGRSLLLTGAPPEVTGINGNEQRGGGRIDHLLARAAAAGISVEGEKWEEWLDLAPVARSAGPSSRFLRIEDCCDCDDVAHAHGTLDGAYQDAADALSDHLLAHAAKLDLAHETLIAVADHGHVETGGHMGVEPEVATVPVLMLGAGVRQGFSSDEPVRMEDVGATAGVLLGLAAPGSSRGVPVLMALDLDKARQKRLSRAYLARRESLETAWSDAVHPARILALRGLAGLGLVLGLVVLLRPAADRSALAALGGPVVGALLWSLFAPPMSANGGPHSLAFAYGAIGFSALASSLLFARLTGACRGHYAPNVLVAWSLPVAGLLPFVGLGPGGLAPGPASFILVLACSYLGLASLLVAAVAALFCLRNPARA